MFTLARNYIREQKNNWLQLLGLGLLVIVMITTFLSLNFATTYITNQYMDEISHNEFHQSIYLSSLSTDSSNIRLKTKAYEWDNDNKFFENMDYYNKDKKNSINKEKFKNATFQLVHAPGYHDNDANIADRNYVYRFIFNYDDKIAHTQNIAIGADFSKKVNNRNFIDFKLSMPLNYPSVAEHYNNLATFATMMNSYVYDSTDSSTFQNRVNFFINSEKAIDLYKDMKSNHELDYATRSNYTIDDIINESKIYQQFIIGMLYGDNVSWRRVSILNDILMSGKTLAFIQNTPQDVVGAPVLIKNGGVSLKQQPLKDDEILVYKDFATQNNLKLGDKFIFSGHKFTIRGLATSSVVANKHLYFTSFDDKNQSIAFVNQKTFEEISSDPYTKIELTDFQGLDPDIASKNIAPTINNYWLYSYFHQLYEKKLNDGTLKGKINILQLLHNPIDAIGFMEPLDYNNINCNNLFESSSLIPLLTIKAIFLQSASVFLILIFVVTVVIIFIIIFKIIDRSKPLIGILKANGYESWKLSLTLMFSIVLPLLFFAIIGAIISIFISKILISGYTSIFALANVSFSFYFLPTILVITLPIIGLLFFSFIIVLYLLRTPALTLISNNWSQRKFSISNGFIFIYLTNLVIKKFNYRNKLVITNSFRSLGKIGLIAVVSIFASTLVLFALVSNGLINNMLGSQFDAIDYKYGSQYAFDGNIVNNFLNSNKELLYKKADVKDIKKNPSLYAPLRQAFNDWISNPLSHPIVNFRYGYIMGSELLKIRREVIEPAIKDDKVPQTFKDFWDKNINYMDYLTNNNGKSETDLMINFGLLAYDSNLENAYSTFNFSNAYSFNINNIDSSVYYDNQNGILEGDWSNYWAPSRTVTGVSSTNGSYFKPNFNVTNLTKFSNLSVKNMKSSSWWQDQNFISVRKQLIDQLGIKNPNTAAVQIIPMVGSSTPAYSGQKNGGDGADLNKTVIYTYQGLDKQIKYIIGVVYDGAKNLQPNSILMPEKWLNQIVLGKNNSSLFDSLANAKYSDLNSNELRNYLPIISKINDYNIDISQIDNLDYINSHGIAPGLKLIYDVRSIKELVKEQQYTFQVLVSFFGIFLVLLTLMIVIIISNINMRDNLILINILRSLGYSFTEISYVFLIVAIPLLIVCGLLSIYIAPLLASILATRFSMYFGIFFPVVFYWWYYALSFLTIILIYFLSYLITWKLNVSHKHLVKLTK